MRVFLVGTIFMVFLAGCGGDGGGDEGGGNTLGINIDDPSDSGVLTLTGRKEALTVAGFVMESPYGKSSDSGCFCGFACLEYPFSPGCYYTRYRTGVVVTVTNQTNGESVLAHIDEDMLAPSESSYRWSASLPLVVGTNRIVARVDDGMGNRGSDVLSVSNP